MNRGRLKAAFAEPPLSWVWECHSQLFLVGGAVRDLLLGRECADFDLLVSEDALGLGARLAERSGGTLVTLDSERHIARVVLPDRTCLDLTELGGSTWEQDLRARDFTINALACAPDGRILDPCGGLADLKRGHLATVGPASLEEDPLRILRAVRLVGELGLSWSPALPAQMRRAGPGLEGVAGERIRDEWFRILSAGLTPRLGLLDASECLPWVLGRQLSLLARLQIRRLEARELDLPPDLWASLSRPDGSRRPLDVLKMALAIPDDPVRWGRSLALSGKEVAALESFRNWPGVRTPADRVGQYRFLLEADRWAPLWVARAALEGACARQCARLYAAWAGRERLVEPPNFLDGHALMAELGLTPGPDLGRLLRQLREDSALERINCRQEALTRARDLLRLWKS